MGGRIEGMPAPLHDLVYAYVSHLPQLLASAAGEILGDEKPAKPNESFERFMRLSRSNMALWADIFALNADNVIMALNRYLDALVHVQNELQSAPESEKNEADESLARCVLFPRIAASCLITTVMEAEKKAGFSFARFAGTGFADVTAPALESPDTNIEQISHQHHATARVLAEYAEQLTAISQAFKAGEFSLD